MKKKSDFSRREFIGLSSSLAVASLLGTKAWAGTNTKPKRSSKAKKPNILFVFTDQERFFSKIPSAFPLPGHERLLKLGTSFESHQISSTMCTSSRSVMMTGLQTIDTGMFDNTDTPYIKNMSNQIPTLGHMLRKAGYYTSYKGKWHLSRDFEDPSYGPSTEKIMDGYGFSDFSSPGDKSAHTLGGYQNDHLTAASAISWLRGRGRTLSDQAKPWSLSVSLVNPHDIMYFNADAIGENVQDTGKLLMHAARAPEDKWYENDWQLSTAPNLRQPLDEAGRPAAHAEFDKAWDYCLGNIPLKEANWQRFTNFYMNSIRSVDYHLNNILLELENLGLAEDTVIVFTADHGEGGGHHGLRGKGPFAYKESTHVPMYVVHPDVKGGSSCSALTSHIDIVPTILTMAGVSETEMAEFAGRTLPGKDFSKVLSNPTAASIHAVRDKSLFTYSGISTNDSEMIRLIAEAKANGENPKEAIKRSGYKPNLKKRGSLRSVFDGRYKFSRYFSPVERHSPKDITELFKYNDVELFDLKNDPDEMKNLAMDQAANAQLISSMSAKLEAAIKEEMKVDDGREMPDFPGIDRALDEFDL